MKGLGSLPPDELRSIVQQFEKERSNRVKVNIDRQSAQRNAAKRRAEEEGRRIIEQETILQKKLELERTDKQRKMNEWLDRARRRDKERATEKQNMKLLVEDRKKHLPASTEQRSQNGSHRKSRSRVAKKITEGLNQEEPEHFRKPSISTTRSALAYYNALAKSIDQVVDPTAQRYYELMESSNYAQSIKLASSVYSRKMSIHA
jgi:hypothetical protein